MHVHSVLLHIVMITMQVDSLSISIFSLIHVWGGSIVSFLFLYSKSFEYPISLFSSSKLVILLSVLNVYDTLPN